MAASVRLPPMPPLPAPPLHAWGLLEVSGADAGAFLHGQFTSDLNRLPEGRAQLSAYCLPKGEVLADFLLWRTAAGGYRLLLPRERCAPVARRLQLFRLRAAVEIEDASEACAFLAMFEPTAGDPPVPPPSEPLAVAEHGEETILAWPDARGRWLRLCPRPAHGAPGDGGDADERWRQLDLEAGLPFVRAGSAERFAPQHLNLDLLDAVSFDKGCYPGQEVVARMRYRGRIKHRTYLLRFPAGAAPEPGAELFPAADGAARPCGHVAEACPLPDGGWLALASLRIASAGAPVRTADAAPAQMLPLPYPLDTPE